MIVRLLEALTEWGRKVHPVNSDKPSGWPPVTYTIKDYFTDEPYLTRVVLPRVGVRFLVHHFHQGDGDMALHNHPWKWCLSVVLAGSYSEERVAREHPLSSARRTYTRLVNRFNWLTHNDFHRVVKLNGDVWTLFLTGPRVQDWGFLEAGKVVPHKEYLARFGVVR